MFDAAFASGKRLGYIELVFSSLCGILLFQDLLGPYGLQAASKAHWIDFNRDSSHALRRAKAAGPMIGGDVKVPGNGHP